MAAADVTPAFQFYPRDFVGDMDVAASSLEEVGAYTVLLCYAWLKDGLPNDPARLARALHVGRKTFDALWTTVGEKFPLATDGRLRNPRQEEERQKQAAYRQSQSDRSARRWHKPADATGQPRQSHGTATAKPAECSSSSSSSSTAEGREDPSLAPANPRHPPACAEDAPETTYQHFRQRASKVRSVNGLPLTPNTYEAKAAIDLCVRYPDETTRYDLIERYLASTHREIRAKPPTLGQVVKWATWLESQPKPMTDDEFSARVRQLSGRSAEDEVEVET